VKVTLQDVITLFGSAVEVIGKYRVARDQWKEANPDPDPANTDQLPDEAVLIELLGADSANLSDRARAIVDKYAAAPVVPDDSVPPPASADVDDN
jgi:hypothetical protein